MGLKPWPRCLYRSHKSLWYRQGLIREWIPWLYSSPPPVWSPSLVFRFCWAYNPFFIFLCGLALIRRSWGRGRANPSKVFTLSLTATVSSSIEWSVRRSWNFCSLKQSKILHRRTSGSSHWLWDPAWALEGAVMPVGWRIASLSEEYSSSDGSP